MPPKPKSVTKAVRLLYVGLWISFFGAIEHLYWVWSMAIRQGLELYFVTICLFALLIAKINQGKNWARMLLLIFYVLTVILAISGLLVSFMQSPPDDLAAAILNVVAWAVGIPALMRLFQKSSNAWFAQVTADRIHAQNPAP